MRRPSCPAGPGRPRRNQSPKTHNSDDADSNSSGAAGGGAAAGGAAAFSAQRNLHKQARAGGNVEHGFLAVNTDESHTLADEGLWWKMPSVNDGHPLAKRFRTDGSSGPLSNVFASQLSKRVCSHGLQSVNGIGHASHTRPPQLVPSPPSPANQLLSFQPQPSSSAFSTLQQQIATLTSLSVTGLTAGGSGFAAAQSGRACGFEALLAASVKANQDTYAFQESKESCVKPQLLSSASLLSQYGLKVGGVGVGGVVGNVGSPTALSFNQQSRTSFLQGVQGLPNHLLNGLSVPSQGTALASQGIAPSGIGCLNNVTVSRTSSIGAVPDLMPTSTSQFVSSSPSYSAQPLLAKSQQQTALVGAGGMGLAASSGGLQLWGTCSNVQPALYTGAPHILHTGANKAFAHSTVTYPQLILPPLKAPMSLYDESAVRQAALVMANMRQSSNPLSVKHSTTPFFGV